MRMVRSIWMVLPVTCLGCSLAGNDLSDDVAFVVQKAPAAGSLQALYQGHVAVEGRCLRLAGLKEAHTVVWPFGFHLGGPGDRYVYDDAGHAIGKIGGYFRLPGGEVPTLWEDGPVAEDVRQRALADCPGRYWLVGEIGN